MAGKRESTKAFAHAACIHHASLSLFHKAIVDNEDYGREGKDTSDDSNIDKGQKAGPGKRLFFLLLTTPRLHFLSEMVIVVAAELQTPALAFHNTLAFVVMNSWFNLFNFWNSSLFIAVLRLHGCIKADKQVFKRHVRCYNEPRFGFVRVHRSRLRSVSPH